jgi:hypothetical protein
MGDELLRSKLTVEILNNLARSEEGNRPTQMAQELGRTRPAVSKMMGQLKETNMVFQDGEKRTSPYKISYEGLAEFWYSSLHDALQNRIDQTSQGEGEMHWSEGIFFEFEEDTQLIHQFAENFFELKLKELNREKTLYELLFYDLSLSLQISWFEHSDYFDDIEYLRSVRTALINYVAKEESEQDIKDLVVRAINSDEL